MRKSAYMGIMPWTSVRLRNGAAEHHRNVWVLPVPVLFGRCHADSGAEASGAVATACSPHADAS